MNKINRKHREAKCTAKRQVVKEKALKKEKRTCID